MGPPALCVRGCDAQTVGVLAGHARGRPADGGGDALGARIPQDALADPDGGRCARPCRSSVPQRYPGAPPGWHAHHPARLGRGLGWPVAVRGAPPRRAQHVRTAQPVFRRPPLSSVHRRRHHGHGRKLSAGDQADGGARWRGRPALCPVRPRPGRGAGPCRPAQPRPSAAVRGGPGNCPPPPHHAAPPCAAWRRRPIPRAPVPQRCCRQGQARAARRGTRPGSENRGCAPRGAPRPSRDSGRW